METFHIEIGKIEVWIGKSLAWKWP